VLVIARKTFSESPLNDVVSPKDVALRGEVVFGLLALWLIVFYIFFLYSGGLLRPGIGTSGGGSVNLWPAFDPAPVLSLYLLGVGSLLGMTGYPVMSGGVTRPGGGP